MICPRLSHMMTKHTFASSAKSVLRLGSLVLVVLTLGGPAVHSAWANRQRQPKTTGQILARIRAAHILAKVPETAFRSFMFSGCMRIDRSLVRKTSSNASVSCITEETGVLQPSLAYVSVTVGTTRITELVDVRQGKGWHIVDPTTFGRDKASRTISPLHKMKYDAVVENAQHSLLALLEVLQTTDQIKDTPLEVMADTNGFVVKWQTERAVNEFFFNRTTFLCEKQVRSVGASKSIMKYSNYKRVGNVMLPHTIVAAKEDGTTMAVREILKWQLAMQWPDDLFHPETVRVLR